ncbi:unnamed protein product [Lactuca saligna]|uniref:Receptor-like serine/threonine-protein kinase n=1 Tax=Lactuca saligna TaxID=75948 RepID=A0AA35ZP76_LACSI|nr:unnamed protein product [Lactuca saligna]
MMRTPCICSFLFGFFLIFSSIAAQLDYVSNANLSTTWTNNESSIPSSNSPDGSRIRIILSVKHRFACGFFCNGTCTSFLFAILFNTNDHVILWSANRDNPVGEGAILNFTAAGELMLQDVDGSIVWTTNTAGKSVAFMDLTDNGNLVLFDNTKSMVWQSFDHPTDCLLPGQKLFQGQKLIPSVSSTNWTAQKDLYHLEVIFQGLIAYIGNPPQVYYSNFPDNTNTHIRRTFIELFIDESGSSSFDIVTGGGGNGQLEFGNHPGFSPLYIKLMPDGHLKAFAWEWNLQKPLEADMLTINGCYPFSCGRNAICLDFANQQCICPETDYFKAVDDQQPYKGCFPVTPLTCNATQDQHFIELKNINYFGDIVDMEVRDVEACKQACWNSCSCKAAIFEYSSNSSSGYCRLPYELFTMTRFEANANDRLHASAFLKVQNRTSTPSSNGFHTLGLIGGSFVLFLILVVGFTTFILQKKKRGREIEEEHLDQVTGMPTRFSYQELKTATDNFSKKLGQGGFGSVFQGTLEDGSQIAVKCLQGLGHVKKSFLAEVESIGSIHHVNLVRLRGFCAWKSERHLVYEFMSNGSSDQWIYDGDRNHILGWEFRKKIILDIAKGLAYLHEECRQKIIHLDIKPLNILLDNDFNAKISDFGLSKLIDKDQSKVITTMRGTPGYLAPEWLSSFITKKVDVYSFGIVLLEILCGRKNFDRSQLEDSWHLLCVFQRCWEHETLLNMVKYSEDMDGCGSEVVEMMKIGFMVFAN